uniref:Uncharacterized protein n=1 Tax=Eutreptiella gymnastica TaxID=73025 RepID=A0A7S1IJJ1_9EUGL|mmetsp:Transcript_23136/g.41690  ORF Transcript_23136/g.41690 Transcript_23136/m.41690 type:complete len:536 (+) Transcript_23136:92-1699(+)
MSTLTPRSNPPPEAALPPSHVSTVDPTASPIPAMGVTTTEWVDDLLWEGESTPLIDDLLWEGPGVLAGGLASPTTWKATTFSGQPSYTVDKAIQTNPGSAHRVRRAAGIQTAHPGPAASRDLRASLAQKLQELEKEQKAADEVHAQEAALLQQMADRQQKEEELMQNKQQKIVLKQQRDRQAIVKGVEEARQSYQEQDAKTEKVRRSEVEDAYHYQGGLVYYRQLSANNRARRKAEDGKRAVEKRAHMMSHLRSEIDGNYTELVDLGDEGALMRAAEAAEREGASFMKNLKAQRDADSAIWQQSFAEKQAELSGIRVDNLKDQKELASLERKSKLHMMKVQAVEDFEASIQASITDVQTEYMRMTRERARNRTTEEWAAQQELIIAAIKREKPGKLVQHKAEEQALAPPVQWSLEGLEINDHLSAERSRPCKAITGSTSVEMQDLQRSNNAATKSSDKWQWDIVAQRNKQVQDRELLQELQEQEELAALKLLGPTASSPLLIKTVSQQGRLGFKRSETPLESMLPEQMLGMSSWA